MTRPGTSSPPAPLVRYRRILALGVLGAFGALGACSDATEPPDDLLDQLDEVGIYTAMVEQLSLFNHTAEANAILRIALGSAIPPADPIPAELFGHTMVYDQDADVWETQAVPAVPDNMLRVTWYAVSGSFVAAPLVERGFVELVDRDDPELTRLDVRAVRTDSDPTTLADYTARFGDTASATTRTTVFEADGVVSDGQRQLDFETRETVAVPLGGGPESTAVRLDLGATGFSYHVDLDESADSQTGAVAVTLLARVVVDGAESRAEIVLQEAAGGQFTGSGGLFNLGQRIADVSVVGTVANPVWTFSRPDGSDYTGNQQRRLGDLLSILLIPLSTVSQYFS